MSTRRIMGVETEFGITFTHEGQRKLAPDDIARQLFRPVVERHRSSNIYLTNGGRLYLDVGSHPEYATPECDSLSQLLVYDRAGEVVMNQLADTAEQSLHTQGIEGIVHLLKNNTDSLGNSYGCHENYLVGRSVILKHLGQQFIPFLISRQIICGAGLVHDGAFTISQRSTHMWEGVSSATTRSRPIINTRDEPHADSERFRRLHVIVGDSNMSETTNALKYGSSLLVLEMLEAGGERGFDFANWEIANDAAAIRAIDLDPLAEVALRDGRSVRGVDIQRTYCEAAARWVEMRDEHLGAVGGSPDSVETAPAGTPTAELRQVVALWGDVLDAVERDDLAALAPVVDWAMKKSIIQQYQAAHGYDLNHPVIKQVDYVYHDIHPQRGLARVLETKGRLRRWQPMLDAITCGTEPVSPLFAPGLFAGGAVTPAGTEAGGGGLPTEGTALSTAQASAMGPAASGSTHPGIAVGLGLPTPEQAVTEPPVTTRAFARGRFLAAAQAHGMEVAVDWTRLKISGGAEVGMLDPFVASDAETDAIIEQLLAEAAERDAAVSTSENDR